MDPAQQQQLKQFLNILLRWKKLILGCFLASLLVGIGQYVKTPKAYQAEALLIYQRSKVNPSNEHTPDITAQAREALATLQDQVLSRSNLEGLVKQFNLYRGALSSLPMEDVIEGMRRKIAIKYTRGDTFTITFQGTTPRTVMLVTNALASKFVEENLRFREETATETSAYIQDELSMAQKALEKKEAAMRDYKLQYYNEMPEQRQINISRLNALQTTYQSIQNSLQELERTKIMVQEQISTRKNYLSQTLVDSLTAIPPGQNLNTDAVQQYQQTARELNKARTELTTLEARYTDQHPEVRRLKKIIAQLEEKLKSSTTTSAGEQQTEEGQQENNLLSSDNQLIKLEVQIKDIEWSMAQLKKEKEEAKRQIETYQQWIAAAPVREAEWAALTRDYEQLAKRYQKLVASNLSAASVETLEKKQKGSQFKVVDSARIPEKPFKPDFKKILVLSLAIGFGLGFAIAFCIEYVDSSFKEAHDLEHYLDLPIICSIPIIRTDKEKKKIFFWNIFWSICFFAVLLSIIVGSVYFWRKGIIII